MTKKEKQAYGKAYREANKEKARAYNKTWREANKEKIVAYLKANSENIKARKKAYYYANYEKARAWRKAYCKAHPEKYRQYRHNRRVLQSQTQVETINEKEVYLRDGWTCQHCKKRVNKQLNWPHPMSPSLDHIIPLSTGGAHIYNNVQLAHLGCNSGKKDGVLPQGEQLRIF